MNKIGDYIPLIIIALSFIYSFVKKINKKEEDEGEKTMLPKGLPQKKVVRPQSQPAPQKVATYQAPAEKKRPEVPGSFLGNYKSLETIPDDVFNPESFQEGMFNEQVEKPMMIENEYEEPVVFDFTSSGELKKGIVYAEIFNRKY